MGERIWYSILAILFFVLIVLIGQVLKYNKAKRMLEKVKWCVSREARDTVLGWPPSSTDPEYTFHKSEYGFLDDIIKNYQDDLVQKYFNGYTLDYDKLSAAREKFYNGYTLDYDKLSADGNYFKGYFIITLNSFLEKHLLDEKLLGEIKTHKSYDFLESDTTYELTDYGVTYHKLYYITQLKCIEFYKNPVHPNDTLWSTLECTKKDIDTREITIIRRQM
jgi:hypothetical protein